MKKTKLKLVFLMVIGVTVGLIISCKKDEDAPKKSVDAGNDPNFKIVANADAGLSSFNRKVEVFGIPIYAVPGVQDNKLLHAANVMAQYLDNDEDGEVDNSAVLGAMLKNKAFLVMWQKESDLNIEPPADRLGQDLGNDETNPGYVSAGNQGEFDAALEEIWHIISHAGYAQAYPEVFGEGAGTVLSNAMDVARGGRFTTIPGSYPDKAWYTYDDATCEYDCQTTEYFYWALTSLLGAQANRASEIRDEWRLNTPEKLEQTDMSVFKLLTNPLYKLPKVLPDGSYRR
ncbi:hypothetical protein DMA11_22400 [Marinilabiliaceae bacterium JC017]|nr:hypothetical protein DMA11_22400 [Marinilabiliaceae bacterium JC017]